MATRWRIRHKLTLGLALVVGIMALLLVGTLKGLLSYRTTMKSSESKLAELKAAQYLQDAVAEVTAAIEGQSGHPQNAQDAQRKIALAQNALHNYRQQLCDTLLHRRDLDRGYDEQALVKALDEQLKGLSALMQEAPPPAINVNVAAASNQTEPRIAQQVKQLQIIVSTLQDHIHTDLSRRIALSKEDYRTSIALVVGTSVLGALFLLGLARLAYRWIVGPIRELHEKVGRLAEGNFDSRIEVQSSDEMQDLAAAFNNMTDRLRHIYQDLARQVNERSRQLVRSERLAGVGFLAAGVAHEINNPLASIAFCSEALERRLRDMHHDLKPSDPDLATVNNYLKMIQEEAFRCKDITQRLLEFSRVGEQRRQMTGIADVVQSVIDMIAHVQSHKSKQIVFQARQRPRIMVNADEIKSVVLNLVVNALDSMEDGGKLTIALDVHDGMAELSFTDTGCGMTPEVLENLFEPFFTRSRTGKGVGLGLSISHRIVTQHGGEIEAHSEGKDRGSTFLVRLPLVATVPQDTIPFPRAA